MQTMPLQPMLPLTLSNALQSDMCCASLPDLGVQTNRPDDVHQDVVARLVVAGVASVPQYVGHGFHLPQWNTPTP